MKNLIYEGKSFEKNIKVDLTTSLGQACRPAQALRRNNLRLFSSPFDWMMGYKLSTILYFFSNGFDDFFSNCEIIGSCGNKHVVRDNITGMISMHSFPIDKSIKEFFPEFITTMKNRYTRLMYLLKKYIFCFVMNRDDFDDIDEFIIKFEYLFNMCHVINIVDDVNEHIKIYKINNSILYNIQFNDEHLNGRTKNNPDWWLGNILKWDNILAHIKLNSNKNLNFNVIDEDHYMK